MLHSRPSRFGRRFAWLITLGLCLASSIAQDAPPLIPPPVSTADAPARTAQETSKNPAHKKRKLASPPCVVRADPEAPIGVTKDCPPAKVVVRNGGASEHAIRLSGANDPQDSHRGQTTDMLLQSTGRNLQQLSKRQLDPAEKEMVAQVLRYTEQSRSATAAGDLELGHNFALKAHLLSDELVNH